VNGNRVKGYDNTWGKPTNLSTRHGRQPCPPLYGLMLCAHLCKGLHQLQHPVDTPVGLTLWRCS